MRTVLAFDFGASSGRAVRGAFDGERVTYEEIHRFENTPRTVEGHLCHDVGMLLGEAKAALQKAGPVDSLAFDTWGVDYGLLDRKGGLLRPPFHYRDRRTQGAMAAALEKISAQALYAGTGSQIMEINTLFQLTREDLAGAGALLFMPDLLAYLLSGARACERSIASTSQMLDPRTGAWNRQVLDAFHIPAGLFAPLVDSGTVVGGYGGAKVIAAAGHDTQCAVAAMPCQRADAAFLSCGTWSLLGCELDRPILTGESARLGLSNELGPGGRVHYLKNISGLWLIQGLRRDLAKPGGTYSYNELEQLARQSQPFRSFIDPDNGAFAAPGGLPGKIRGYCRESGQPEPETVGQLVRCVYESLALKYRFALGQVSQCTGKRFGVLHLLGGGAKDSFLCQLTADSLGVPVIAGPVEATALGNILLQLAALGEVKNVEEGRALVARTEKTTRYEPAPPAGWDGAYQEFCTIINREE